MKQQPKPVRGIFEKDPGSGIWHVRYTDASGRYRRELAGSWSQASKLLTKRRNEALMGRKLPELLRRRAVPFTKLADLTEAYIKRKYSKPEHDLGRLKKIREWFSSCSGESIGLTEIEAALNKAKEAGNWSASTFNHYHTLLSLTFRLAVRSGKLDTNPMRGMIEREAENNSRVRYLTAEEEQKLREAIRQNSAWREHEPELTFAINTGLRRKNMYLDLVWKDVDLDARLATVRTSKNGDPVHVPLNADAMVAIHVFRSRGDGNGRVIRNEAGEPLNYPTHWFVPAVRAAGINDYTWHDNRHTFASRLRQKGVPLSNIAELLGHKGLTMTKRYAHLSISNLHDAVAKISTTISTTVAPELVSEKQEVVYVQ